MQDTEVDYSNILTLGGVDIAIGDSSGAKKALPAGTKRNAFRGYEVVDVPALDPGRLLPPAQLVEISVLEDWAQTAFKGYKALNRIQSQIFQVRRCRPRAVQFPRRLEPEPARHRSCLQLLLAAALAICRCPCCCIVHAEWVRVGVWVHVRGTAASRVPQERMVPHPTPCMPAPPDDPCTHACRLGCSATRTCWCVRRRAPARPTSR